MSLNRKVVETFERNDRDKFGKIIPIYRRRITYRSKKEVEAFRAEEAAKLAALIEKYNAEKKEKDKSEVSEVEYLPVEDQNINPMAQ